VGFLEKYLPSSYELSFTHRLLTLLEMAEEFQKCVARMATLPKSGLNGQNSPARGKASGRTPLALPRENTPFIFPGFRRIRPPWRKGGFAGNRESVGKAESPPTGGMLSLTRGRGCQKTLGKTQLIRGGKFKSPGFNGPE